MTTLIERMEKKAERLNASELAQFECLKEIVTSEHVDALEYYLEQGYNINARNKVFRNIAFYIQDTLLYYVELLVSKGLDIFVIDVDGNTPLHEMCATGNAETVKYLISLGADPYQEDFTGTSAAFNAIYNFSFGSSLIEELCPDPKLPSLFDTLRDRDFALSLSIVQKELAGLGGFQRLFDNVHKSEIRVFLTKLYNILVLNERYEDAKNLLTIFIEKYREVDETFWSELTFDFSLPLLMGNRELLVKVVNENQMKSDGYYKDLNEFYAHICLQIFDKDDDSSFIKKKFKNSLKSKLESEDTYILGHLIALFEPTELSFLDSARRIEGEVEDSPLMDQQMQRNFLLGMLYFSRGDLINAEYIFHKTTTFLDNSPTQRLTLYTQSVTLMKYIQQQRETLQS